MNVPPGTSPVGRPQEAPSPAAKLTVQWVSANRAPKCAPDPAYPDGMIVDMAGSDAAGCWADLPYPAECCGLWLIGCPVCGASVAVTAAGRPDDAKRVRIPCKLGGQA